MYNINIEHPPADVSVFRFSGGEPHVSLPEINDDVYIHAGGLRDWRCLDNLLVILNALSYRDEVGHVHVYMPYFPGARQDRTDGFTPVTVQLVAGMLAAATMNDDDKFIFYTFDIHSDLALREARSRIQLINLPVSMLVGSEFDEDIDTIIAPDKGARDRATIFRDTHFPDAHIVFCEKERKFATGGIFSYTVPDVPEHLKKALVVDDICDGGATFNLLGDEWDTKSGALLQLYVSHGLFSRGLGNIDSLYGTIYTTSSIVPTVPPTGRLRYVTLPTPYITQAKESYVVPSTIHATN